MPFPDVPGRLFGSGVQVSCSTDVVEIGLPEQRVPRLADPGGPARPAGYRPATVFTGSSTGRPQRLTRPG